MTDSTPATAAQCVCESGVPAPQRCAGDATDHDGLCDYCRTNEWCVQWRAEQEAKGA